MAIGILALAIVLDAPPAQPSPDVLDLVIVDAEDGHLLPGVSLHPVLSTGGDTKRPPAELTDERGGRRIDVTGGPWFFVGISARMEGYVPVWVRWNADQLKAGLPASYRLKLERGATIGGTVQDARGRPIAGASVYPSLWGKGTRSEPEALYLDDGYHIETDARGRWRCTMMPASLGKDDQLSFGLRHRDFASDPVAIQPRTLPFERLRAMAGVFVMEDGLPITGSVVDDRGSPIAGATVVLGLMGYQPMPEIVRARTDAAGRFRLDHAPPGRHNLLVEADGHGPVGKQIFVEPGQPPVEVRLGSYARAQEWARERAAEEKKEADAWKNWLMGGLIALSTFAALVSWVRDRRRRAVGDGR